MCRGSSGREQGEVREGPPGHCGFQKPGKARHGVPPEPVEGSPAHALTVAQGPGWTSDPQSHELMPALSQARGVVPGVGRSLCSGAEAGLGALAPQTLGLGLRARPSRGSWCPPGSLVLGGGQGPRGGPAQAPLGLSAKLDFKSGLKDNGDFWGARPCPEQAPEATQGRAMTLSSRTLEAVHLCLPLVPRNFESKARKHSPIILEKMGTIPVVAGSEKMPVWMEGRGRGLRLEEDLLRPGPQS